ncbi:piggyBac transposable element-derived protein 4-like [Homalodisca vitripennis]|uniref:piggyBac transposable element-derived protein 4-like n=1 Tax=Homalodisca vitripennis TaxID=197043 RepID=UPI001EEC7E65|nr:piggyBac transposable element-derived protein 4-like [Homalodisca vitripennis]
MVPWRGRLNFRQYLPDKSHKYGVKIYKLCSPDGYTCKFKIYVGKGDITSGKGHKQKIMLHLIHDFLGHGRLLYADNYYNSVELAEALLKRKTYLCGTLRKDLKSNPKTVISKKLKKGEVYAQENKQGVKVISWVDKRRVNLISTRPEDGDNLLPSKKTNRNNEPIMKPSCVLAYNDAKKGVDVSDQMSSYYSPLRKTSKWYKKVALELLLGTCVVNAFVVFNSVREKKAKWDMLKFRSVFCWQESL